MFNPFSRFMHILKQPKLADDELVSAYGILMPQRTRKNLSIITIAASIGILYAVITGFPGASPILTAFYKDELQMSDGLLSIVLSIPQVAVLIQIPISLFLSKRPNLKKMFIVSALLVRFAFVGLALVAFLSSTGRMTLAHGRLATVAIVTLSSLSLWASDITLNTWLGLAIPYQCRGRYLSTRQMVFTFSSLVFVLALMFISSPLAKVHWQYSFYFLLAAIFGIIDISLFVRVHYTPTKPKTQDKIDAPEENVSEAQPSNNPSIKDITLPVKDKNYRTFLAFIMVWYFAVAIPQPFFNVHMNNYLNLSLGVQTLLTTGVTALGTVLFIRRMGRGSDFYGYRNMLLLTATVSVFLPFIWLFISPALSGLIIFANMLSGIFFVSTDMNVLSMSIFLAPSDKRPNYLVGKTLAQALLGTVPGMLLGGQLMERLAPVLEKAKLPFVSGQVLMPFHVVLLLSFVLRAVAVLVFARKIQQSAENPGFKAFLYELWQWVSRNLSGFNRRLRDALWFKPRGQDYVSLGRHPLLSKIIHRFPFTRALWAKLLRRRKQRILLLEKKSLNSQKLDEERNDE